jgi:putative transposase
MRRSHDTAFKARVALEALKAEKTIAQIASEYGVHSNQIRQWRQKRLEDLPQLFSDHRRKEEKDGEALQAELYRQIGQLKVEKLGLVDEKFITETGSWLTESTTSKIKGLANGWLISFSLFSRFLPLFYRFLILFRSSFALVGDPDNFLGQSSAAIGILPLSLPVCLQNQRSTQLSDTLFRSFFYESENFVDIHQDSFLSTL